MWCETMNNKILGNAGEDLACRYLQKRGYQILERNKHYSRYCELDIIAKFNDTVVFVEVKTRKTDAFGAPLEAVTKSKFANMKKGASFYLSEHPTKNYRFDIIAITIKPELKIEHIKNIF